MKYCIVSINAELSIVAWGPFNRLAIAKKFRKQLRKKYPHPKHLLLNFQDMSELRSIRVNDIEEEKEPCKHSGYILTLNLDTRKTEPYCNTCSKFVKL